MNKQTAVEWLEYRYKHNINLMEGDFVQAKQMEKEQITDSWYDGISGGQCGTSEQYYNETYGGTKI